MAEAACPMCRGMGGWDCDKCGETVFVPLVRSPLGLEVCPGCIAEIAAGKSAGAWVVGAAKRSAAREPLQAKRAAPSARPAVEGTTS